MHAVEEVKVASDLVVFFTLPVKEVSLISLYFFIRFRQ
jgi:hypothetical protein